MHVLPLLRRACSGQCLPELRWRLLRAAHTTEERLERRQLSRRVSSKHNSQTLSCGSSLSQAVGEITQGYPTGTALMLDTKAVLQPEKAVTRLCGRLSSAQHDPQINLLRRRYLTARLVSSLCPGIGHPTPRNGHEPVEATRSRNVSEILERCPKSGRLEEAAKRVAPTIARNARPGSAAQAQSVEGSNDRPIGTGGVPH